MKKFLLVVSLISILFLVGCNSNKNEEINNLSGVNENQEIINDEVTFDKDFDERIAPYTDYISNTNFISNVDESSGFLDVVHYISKAKLENINDKYKLTLTISEPIFFKAEDVQAIHSELESNDTAKLGEYIFYKNVDLLKSSRDWSEPYLELIDSEEIGSLATDSEGMLYLLFPNTEEKLEYKIAFLTPVGAAGFVQTNPVKDIEIELYPNDVIVIRHMSKEITVKDFYEKALNKEVDEEGFEYNLDNIGDSFGTYGEYVDGVTFENGKIIIDFTLGV